MLIPYSNNRQVYHTFLEQLIWLSFKVVPSSFYELLPIPVPYDKVCGESYPLESNMLHTKNITVSDDDLLCVLKARFEMLNFRPGSVCHN